jgi:hypothetical protein
MQHYHAWSSLALAAFHYPIQLTGVPIEAVVFHNSAAFQPQLRAFVLDAYLQHTETCN